MSATPAGWYDDGHGARRWWDGIQWTDHLQPAPAAADPVAAPPVHTPSPTAYTLEGDPPLASSAPYAVPGYAASASTPAGTAVGYPSLPPTAPTSRLWILWAVLGILALGAVITAIVVIPMALAGLTGVAESDEGTQGGGSAPSAADESAAVATIRLYDEAWQQVDCDKYLTTTTAAFRIDIKLPDCATFEESAQGFADGTEDYLVTVTGVVQDDDVITVSTSETFSNLVDEDGAPLESPEAVEDQWEYYLIADGEAWLIDGAE